MSDWPRDEWAEAGARDYLEALGVLSLRYDRLQLALIRLIESYLIGIPDSILNQILFPMNNSQRLNLLKQIAVEMEQCEEVRELIAYFQKGFSICTENRNIVLHAGGHLGDTHFHFIKNRRGPPFDNGVYSVSLKGLRAICDSISEMTDFAWDINLYIRSETGRYRLDEYEDEKGFEIPQKPILPRKLVLPKDGSIHPDGPIFF